MDNVNISVLTPSRGRMGMLEQNFYKMYKMARFPEKVESLVYIDEDDTESINFYNKDFLKEYHPYVKIFVGPRVGFAYMHIMIKQLAALSKGDIILPVPDDCNFTVQNWEDYLLPYIDKELVLYHKFKLAITRKAYEKFECIKNFSGFSSFELRHERRLKRPLDAALRKYAFHHGICARGYRIYGESIPRDKTAQEGRGEQWSLQDTSILDNLPIRELTL